LGVKQIATAKISQAAARYGEQAPMATACCNACRNCLQTNLLGVGFAALATLGAAVKRAVGRSAD